jgi:hypothetical protein
VREPAWLGVQWWLERLEKTETNHMEAVRVVWRVLLAVHPLMRAAQVRVLLQYGVASPASPASCCSAVA